MNLLKMRLDDSLRLATLGGRQANVHGQVYCRGEPELCLPVRVGNVHVDASFFPRDEEQPELPVADDRGCHARTLAEPSSALRLSEALGRTRRRLTLGDDDMGLNLAFDSAMTEPRADFSYSGVCGLNQSGRGSRLDLASEQCALAVRDSRNAG